MSKRLECVVDDSICHHRFGTLKLLSMDTAEKEFSESNFWNEVRDGREPAFWGVVFGIPTEWQEPWMGRQWAANECQLCEKIRQ